MTQYQMVYDVAIDTARARTGAAELRKIYQQELGQMVPGSSSPTVPGVPGSSTGTTSLIPKNASQMLGAVGLGAYAPLLAGGGVVVGLAALSKGIKAAQEDAKAFELAQADLNAVLKSTHQVAGLSKTQLNLYADALQRDTRMSNENINAAQGLLLTYTNIGKDAFPRATAITLDMTEKLGGMEGQATRVGKALQDPIKGVSALREVGVNFTTAQAEMITKLVESNDLLGAQDIILKELETEFGGAAKAAGETYAGALDKLANARSDLRVELGKALIADDSIFRGMADITAEQISLVTAKLQIASDDMDTRVRGYTTQIAYFQKQIDLLEKAGAEAGGRRQHGLFGVDTNQQLEAYHEWMTNLKAELAAVESEVEKLNNALPSMYDSINAKIQSNDDLTQYEQALADINAQLVAMGVNEEFINSTRANASIFEIDDEEVTKMEKIYALWWRIKNGGALRLDEQSIAALEPYGSGNSVFEGAVSLGATDTANPEVTRGLQAAEAERNAVTREENKETAEQMAKDQKKAAEEAADAWQREFDAMFDELKGRGEEGINVSIKLSDLRGDMPGSSEPGANGWAEDIYRLQAWLNDNSWQETADKYGISSKEQGADIVRKFQTKQWDESVTQMLDKDKLVEAIHQEQTGQAFIDAFFADVAAAAGTGPSIVEAIVNGGATDSGDKTDYALPLAEELQAQMDNDEFRGKMMTLGGMMARSMAQGWVDEIGKTPWASEMENAILENIIDYYESDGTGGSGGGNQK